jgi:hypothetical protein
MLSPRAFSVVRADSVTSCSSAVTPDRVSGMFVVAGLSKTVPEGFRFPSASAHQQPSCTVNC